MNSLKVNMCFIHTQTLYVDTSISQCRNKLNFNVHVNCRGQLINFINHYYTPLFLTSCFMVGCRLAHAE